MIWRADLHDKWGHLYLHKVESNWRRPIAKPSWVIREFDVVRTIHNWWKFWVQMDVWQANEGNYWSEAHSKTLHFIFQALPSEMWSSQSLSWKNYLVVFSLSSWKNIIPADFSGNPSGFSCDGTMGTGHNHIYRTYTSPDNVEKWGLRYNRYKYTTGP